MGGRVLNTSYLHLRHSYYTDLLRRIDVHIWYCGGTGTDSTVPTNTVQVPITTGTVTDSGSG